MQNATTIIVAEGALEIQHMRTLMGAIEALAAQGQVRVIVDWLKAEAINPLALGLLLAQRHALLEKGGELKFCRMRPEIKQIFFRFGVDEFFENYETLEDAIESFDEDWQGGDNTAAH